MLSSVVVKQMINNKPFLRGIVRNFVTGRNLNKTKSRPNLKFYVKGTSVGIAAGAIIYDGINEFRIYGGATRFLRSLKIAALISIDYSWHLYGLTEGNEEYEQVRLKIIFFFFFFEDSIHYSFYRFSKKYIYVVLIVS